MFQCLSYLSSQVLFLVFLFSRSGCLQVSCWFPTSFFFFKLQLWWSIIYALRTDPLYCFHFGPCTCIIIKESSKIILCGEMLHCATAAERKWMETSCAQCRPSIAFMNERFPRFSSSDFVKMNGIKCLRSFHAVYCLLFIFIFSVSYLKKLSNNEKHNSSLTACFWFLQFEMQMFPRLCSPYFWPLARKLSVELLLLSDLRNVIIWRVKITFAQ